MQGISSYSSSPCSGLGEGERQGERAPNSLINAPAFSLFPVAVLFHTEKLSEQQTEASHTTDELDETFHSAKSPPPLHNTPQLYKSHLVDLHAYASQELTNTFATVHSNVPQDSCFIIIIIII